MVPVEVPIHKYLFINTFQSPKTTTQKMNLWKSVLWRLDKRQGPE